MSKSAVLLIDLQQDFLDSEKGRMPVDPHEATTVLRVANAVLAQSVFAQAIPILVVNQFPANAKIANFFRKGAAVVGSVGAEIDARLEVTGNPKVIGKAKPSAFSNPNLQNYLQENKVQSLLVLGVFAEGCVRATVLDALKLGYSVQVLTDAVATNAPWKKRFALWSMRRAGASLKDSPPFN